MSKVESHIFKTLCPRLFCRHWWETTLVAVLAVSLLCLLKSLCHYFTLLSLLWTQRCFHVPLPLPKAPEHCHIRDAPVSPTSTLTFVFSDFFLSIWTHSTWRTQFHVFTYTWKPVSHCRSLIGFSSPNLVLQKFVNDTFVIIIIICMLKPVPHLNLLWWLSQFSF